MTENKDKLIEDLVEALRPFAAYADTLKEWHRHGEFYINKPAHPDHKPVLRGTFPCLEETTTTIACDNLRQLWVADFRKATQLLKEIKDE